MFKWLSKLLKQPEQRQLVADLETIAATHGLEIAADKRVTDNTITHTELRKEHLVRACELLSNELALYPPRVIKKSRLNRIQLVSELEHKKSKVGGLFTSAGNVMFLSLDQLGTAESQRRGFHHELFHCIDWYDDSYKWQDPHWITLNDPGFAYSQNWKSQTNAFKTRNGFMTSYSMTEVWEDKAELYAHMIVHHATVSERADYDPVINKKMQRMVQLLGQFSDDYSFEFWRQRNKNSAYLPSHPSVDASFEIRWRKKESKDVYSIERTQTLILRPPVTFANHTELVHCLSELGLGDRPEVKNLFKEKTLILRTKCNEGILRRYGLG